MYLAKGADQASSLMDKTARTGQNDELRSSGSAEQRDGSNGRRCGGADRLLGWAWEYASEKVAVADVAGSSRT